VSHQLASTISLRSLRRHAASTLPRARRGGSVRVVVDWSSPAPSGTPAASSNHVELLARLEDGPSAAWSCLGPKGWAWEEAIGVSRCEEVVLTTRLGDEPAARDLVLELAERLTQLLSGSQPLIRVRFLPRAKGRAS
jgi:hypothetical protein